MLKHLNSSPETPNRVVVIGAHGFVGSAISQALKERHIDVLEVGRPDVDLLEEGAVEMIKQIVRPTDSLVFVSAIAPVKNLNMMRDNLKIISVFEALLHSQTFHHVLNISSDAVYGDFEEPLTESTPTNAGSLHGLMHATRELVLSEACGDTPFATLRPTLIYGENDPHNGYGPNRFRRLAAAGQDITLFGEGEERRDHISINDVAELAARILLHKSSGSLNAATGTVISFREIAETIAHYYSDHVTVKGSPRVGAMPHNGYRAFDISATQQAFPDFNYIQPLDGFRTIYENEQKV